jgi:hypothetical protein
MDTFTFLQNAYRSFCANDWTVCKGVWVDAGLVPCEPCREDGYDTLFPLGQTIDWASRGWTP